MSTSEMQLAADEIFEVLSKTPIVNCTAYIIAVSLRRSNEKSARNEFWHDGDKLASSAFEPIIVKHLGCRTHNTKNCKKWPCFNSTKNN